MKKILISLIFIIAATLAYSQNSTWGYAKITPSSTDTILIWHNDTTYVTTWQEILDNAGLSEGDVSGIVGDTMDQVRTDAVQGLALQDSGEYVGGYITPTMLDVTDADISTLASTFGLDSITIDGAVAWGWIGGDSATFGTPFSSRSALEINAPVYEADYYVAPWGSDSNDGSFASPFGSLHYAMNQLTPSSGDTLYMRGGTYYPSGSLISGYYTGAYVDDVHGVNVFNYPGEVPVMDCGNISDASNRAGLYIKSDNFHVKGLYIKNVHQHSSGSYSSKGFTIVEAHDVILENCITSHNGGVGFEVTLNGVTGNGNSFINCDSHHNYDVYNDGEDADGFEITNAPLLGDSFLIEGCRAWNNSDDGFDGWHTEGVIRIKDCWSWSNGYDNGDGAGFKLGATDSAVSSIYIREVSNCIGYGNTSYGLTENATDGLNKVINNTFYKNGAEGVLLSGADVASVFRNNITHDNVDGPYDDWFGVTSYIIDHSTYDASYASDGPTVSDDDFFSLDTLDLYKDRKLDGSLPDIDFGKLKPSSDLVEAGIDVGLDYNGNVPDIGAYESGVSKPVTVDINAQTGTTYTLTLTDQGKIVTLTNGSAIALTVPTNATTPLSIGTKIHLACLGAGTVTVGGSGITWAASITTLDIPTGKGATIIKLATDTWWIIGGIE